MQAFLWNKIHFTIGHLIFISLVLHVLAIGFPSDGGKVFDEAFYVPAANDLLKGIPSNLEHPFLGKLWGSIGIAIFGNNWFGWRIPMVAFGMGALYVFYNLARLFLDERKALIATAFLSFDIIFFVHSSLLLLDVPPLLFAFLGFYLYFKERYYLSAASFGMSILSKEWGVLFVLCLFVYHMISKRPFSLRGLNINKPMLAKTGKFAAVLVLVVVLPLWGYYWVFQPKVTFSQVPIDAPDSSVKKVPIQNPIDQFKYMTFYQSSLTTLSSERALPDAKTNFWSNFPQRWTIPYEVDPPVYFETTVRIDSLYPVPDKHPVSWKGIGNFPIWLSIWAIVPYTAINIARKKASKLDYLIIAWIIGTYLPWFYVADVMHRVVYAFYFINVVPILAIGIPYLVQGISKGWVEKIILFGWLAAAIVFFFYYFPVNVFDF